MTNPFESTDTVKTSLSRQNYISSDEITAIVYLAG